MVLKLIVSPFFMVGHGQFSNPLSSLASHLSRQASMKTHALRNQSACIRKLLGVLLSNHAKHSSHLGPAWMAAQSYPESNSE